MAAENDQPTGSQAAARTEIKAAAIESKRDELPPIGWERINDDEAAEKDIEATFGAMLRGLRRLPRYQRPLALRAAREWRQLARSALREKRARERRARCMTLRHMRMQRRPAPE
jgi:hypothetical protein